jgi:hypothetical protein
MQVWLRYETIGDLLASPGMGVFARCQSCSHSSMVDIKAVADRLGPGLSVKRLEKRLRCQKCRRWNCKIELVHGTLRH